ncbi:MAG: PQQ-dependent sugar dehydrogenase [Candidatus Methanospirareceae archaeon]
MSVEETLLRNWWVYPGFELDIVATGLDLPVNIAFVPYPRDDPTAPLLYVTELYGQVKVLTNDLRVHTYAKGLLNFDPSHEFPGSGESGLTGICVEPETGDLFLSMIYLDEDAIKGKVVRTSSTDELTMNSMKVVVDDIPSTTRAHQIQAVTIGFDGKLYVNVADGGEWEKAQDDNDLRGKILRMDQDGTIPWDNPNPQSYVYAKGFRNPFGAAWRKSDQSLYIAGNGPDVDDRIAKVRPFENYGWPGTMRKNSIFWWHHTQAPTALDFMQDGQFPPQFNDDLFVALFGAAYAKGKGEKGKKIVKLRINEDGTGIRSYDEFVVYQGREAASPCGLAFGPDGLYFTDLHGEKDGLSSVAGGTIYRVRPNAEQFGYLRERERTYGKRWASLLKE